MHIGFFKNPNSITVQKKKTIKPIFCIRWRYYIVYSYQVCIVQVIFGKKIKKKELWPLSLEKADWDYSSEFKTQ